MRIQTVVLQMLLVSMLGPLPANAKTSAPTIQCSVGYGKCMSDAYKGLDSGLNKCTTKYSSDQAKFNKCYNSAIAALNKLKKACSDNFCKAPDASAAPAPAPQ